MHIMVKILELTDVSFPGMVSRGGNSLLKFLKWKEITFLDKNYVTTGNQRKKENYPLVSTFNIIS